MRTSPLRHSRVNHTVLPANTPHLSLPHSLPEGATTELMILIINRPREDERLSWHCVASVCYSLCHKVVTVAHDIAVRVTQAHID